VPERKRTAILTFAEVVNTDTLSAELHGTADSFSHTIADHDCAARTGTNFRLVFGDNSKH
jgi:hypothetical protein